MNAKTKQKTAASSKAQASGKSRDETGKSKKATPAGSAGTSKRAVDATISNTNVVTKPVPSPNPSIITPLIKEGDSEIVARTVKEMPDGSKVVTTVKKVAVKVVKKRAPDTESQSAAPKRQTPSPAPPNSTPTTFESPSKIKGGKKATTSSTLTTTGSGSKLVAKGTKKPASTKPQKSGKTSQPATKETETKQSIETPTPTPTPPPDEEKNPPSIVAPATTHLAPDVTPAPMVEQAKTPVTSNSPPVSPDEQCPHCHRDPPTQNSPHTCVIPPDHKCPTLDELLAPDPAIVAAQEERRAARQRRNDERRRRNEERQIHNEGLDAQRYQLVKDKYYLCVKDQAGRPMYNTAFANTFCQCCKPIVLPEPHRITCCEVCRNVCFDDIPLLL